MLTSIVRKILFNLLLVLMVVACAPTLKPTNTVPPRPPAKTENSVNEIFWFSYSDGLVETAQGLYPNVLVLLFFKADYCEACRSMMTTTFHDPEIVNLIDNHFIAIKVDAPTNLNLMKKYLMENETPVVPTLVIISNGKSTRIPGYQSANTLSVLLTDILMNGIP